MVKKSKSLKVFFNASVILAGLHSPRGGSAKLLTWAKKRKISGIASEIILDEVLSRCGKINITKNEVNRKLQSVLSEITPPPKRSTVDAFKKIVVDVGDAHVLASGKETKADYIVSLDKKHILVLKGKFKNPKIVSPGELIEIISD
mgnify:CR=1 FL=1